MIRLSDGDRSACSSVFSLLWPELVAFAERTLGKGADADDAAQLALEKIFAQASDYDAQRSALAWALAITAWECRTVLRRRSRRREQPLDTAAEDAVSPASDPESAHVESTMLSALRGCLEDLAPRDRATLEEAFYREAEGPQAPAFRKRKERALQRLRTAWRKIYGD